MSRQLIINNASSDIGLAEEGNNLTKYGEWYGMNGVAWCAISVSYWYFHSGHPLPKIDTDCGFHYVPTLVNRFKSKETTKPNKADVFCIDFNGDGKWDHTGLFVGWENAEKTKFWTIEGNTSPDEKGSQSNGGMVCRKVRTYNPAKVKFYNLFD